MTDPFSSLLVSLGTLFGLPLTTDKHNACALQIKKGFTIQLQPDETMEKILIITRVAEVNPGKFREEVLKEALKANGLPALSIGIFAYLAKTNSLILFQHYPMENLTGEKLANLVLPFIDLAETWKTALQAGKPGPGLQQTAPPLGAFFR